MSGQGKELAPKSADTKLRAHRTWIFVGACLTLAGSGCAADGRPTWKGLMKHDAQEREEKDFEPVRSTIGIDKQKAPKGETMPASGLGVDMI